MLYIIGIGEKNKMKRSQKRLLKITALVLGITFLIGAFMQGFVFVGESYHGTVRCDKEIGCTEEKRDLCNDKIDDIEREGWQCDSGCQIYCSNTAEMVRRDKEIFQPAGYKCSYFRGGGALVEWSAKCTLTEPKSHDKYICSNGNNHVFDSSSDYPDEIEFAKWDVYWMNEIDQLEERKDNCDSDEICQQYSSTRAKCIDVESDDRYIKQDHKGCYTFSSRWEIWWFDSNNKISERIEICSEICDDGKCIEEKVPADERPGTADCIYGSCTDDTTQTCKDGSKVTAYECTDGCAIPTTEYCPEEDNVPPEDRGGSGLSNCNAWERETLNAECIFDWNKITDFEVFKKFIKANATVAAIIAGIVLIGTTLLFTGKKKKKGGLL